MCFLLTLVVLFRIYEAFASVRKRFRCFIWDWCFLKLTTRLYLCKMNPYEQHQDLIDRSLLSLFFILLFPFILFLVGSFFLLSIFHMVLFMFLLYSSLLPFCISLLFLSSLLNYHRLSCYLCLFLYLFLLFDYAMLLLSSFLSLSFRKQR